MEWCRRLTCYVLPGVAISFGTIHAVLYKAHLGGLTCLCDDFPLVDLLSSPLVSLFDVFPSTKGICACYVPTSTLWELGTSSCIKSSCVRTSVQLHWLGATFTSFFHEMLCRELWPIHWRAPNILEQSRDACSVLHRFFKCVNKTFARPLYKMSQLATNSLDQSTFSGSYFLLVHHGYHIEYKCVPEHIMRASLDLSVIRWGFTYLLE